MTLSGPSPSAGQVAESTPIPTRSAATPAGVLPPGSGQAGSLVTDLSPMDEIRRKALVRMKLFATGLLLVMAIVFVIAWSLQDAHPAWGYVRAAAEAGMVGALADWFAVTALFRHPLGLPIPHTAIIPNRKDAIGSSLSEFVATNFLSEQVVRDKLAGFGVARRAGGWLERPESAERLVAEGARAVQSLSTVLADDRVIDLLASIAKQKISDTVVGPPVGKIAADLFSRGEHHALVDFLVDRCYQWVKDNYSMVSRVVSDRAPSWTPRFVDSIVADRIYAEVEGFARAVRDDPQHELRLAIDSFLQEFADDLQHDPATMRKADAIKERILANEQLRGLASGVWTGTKDALLQAVSDPTSSLRRSAVESVIGFGRTLSEGGSTARRLDSWVADAAGYVAANHARSITGIIDETIARWDGAATSRKIELQIGRDLQFIRINGTVVGSLAGLVIYTVAHLVLG